MSKEPSSAKKLKFDLQITDNKISVRASDDHTNFFLKKTWFRIVNQLFDDTQIEKIHSDSVLFQENFLIKDLKIFKQSLDAKLKAYRYCSSINVYKRGLEQTIDKIFNIKITMNTSENKEEKKYYRDFILCYDFKDINDEHYDESISFDTNDPNVAHRLGKRPLIKRGRNRFFAKDDEVQLRLPKVQFFIYFSHENHAKIKQVLSNMEQNRQEWLLYPMNPYLDTFSMDKIYYEELIQKTLVKKSLQINKIIEKFDFEMVEKKIKILKDDSINHNSEDPDHPDLEEGYFLGFHVFGQAKNFYQFYIKINEFFQSRRMWVLRPQKICCCLNLAELQDYMKEKENLETYLIYDHIMVIIKSQQEVNKLTSLTYRQQMNKDSHLTEEERLLQILQTGDFTLDTNDFDQEDLQHIYKERERYKEYLFNQFRIKIEYLPASNKRKLYLHCEISAYRIFKGNIYCFINDFKSEKEQLKQFNTPFHVHLFEKYIRKDLEAEFPEIQFVVKKKENNTEQVWAKFHGKDRAQFMEKLNEIVKKFEYEIDYIVCRKEPIPQKWFACYRRPHKLSIHTLTCRKYFLSRETKVYVQPYQSLSRPVDEMLFLIDQSFENCWEFVEIAEKNDINLMSLFLEFQEKKTKKADRIKAIPLTNHRYINKMLIWYNDMFKKIQNRRQQDIKKLYKRYQEKFEMHIMIPRHATQSILLNFVLPSFIKEFTQQTGYNLKQIYFYYPIMFDEGHRYIENLTLRVIDQEMMKAKIELQNQNYLSKDSIKKIIQMEYLTLHCMFEGDQRILKATNLSSYIFYMEREVIIQKRMTLAKSASPQNKKKLLNFSIPLFFMDSSFNNQILVDLVEEVFYKVGKVVVEGPFEIKSDQKYEDIAKCVNTIKKIFRCLSYVVIYVDKDHYVSKNGYYYSHKDFAAGQNVIRETKVEKQKPQVKDAKDKNFKKIKQSAAQDMTFNAQSFSQNSNISFMPQSQTQSQAKSQNQTLNPNLSASFQKNTLKEQNQAAPMPKIILYPMKIELNSHTAKKFNKFEESGKIIKRDAKRLIIELIESEMPIWYMAQTFKDKIEELEQYLKNPNNYKNNENNLLGDISEYSILDLKDEQEQSRFLNFEEEVKEEKKEYQWYLEHQKEQMGEMSMGSIDLSVIYEGSHEKDQNNLSDKMSFLQQMNDDSLHDMSTYSEIP